MVVQTRPMHFTSGVFKVLHGSREVPGSGEISGKDILRRKAFRTTWDEDGRGQEPWRFPGKT